MPNRGDRTGDGQSDSTDALREAEAAFSSRDYTRALRLYKPIAEAGDARAQMYVSWLYQHGRGNPESHVLAYMWADIAAKQGSEHAAGYRRSLSAEMTDRELAQARYLSAAWVPTVATPERVSWVRRFAERVKKQIRDRNSPAVTAVPPVTRPRLAPPALSNRNRRSTARPDRDRPA